MSHPIRMQNFRDATQRNLKVRGRQTRSAAAFAMQQDTLGATAIDEVDFLGRFLPKKGASAVDMVRILLSLAKASRSTVKETLTQAQQLTPSEAKQELDRMSRLAEKLQHGASSVGGAEANSVHPVHPVHPVNPVAGISTAQSQNTSNEALTTLHKIFRFPQGERFVRAARPGSRIGAALSSSSSSASSSGSWGQGLFSGNARWDAVYDGHLATRRTTWALGLVRYWVSFPSGHAQRITAATTALAESAGLSGSDFRNAVRLWLDRRAILFIDNLTALTVKLAHDLWLMDPHLGVVLTRSGTHGENPFRALGIPFLEDSRGLLTALLGVDDRPALLEPRLGGVTITCASGILHFGRMKFDWEPDAERSPLSSRMTAVPAWMRTMAEIGFLEHNAALLTGTLEGEKDTRDMMTLLHRHRLLRLYQRLLGAPIEKDPSGIPLPALRTIRAARQDYLAGRERLLAIVCRLINQLQLNLSVVLRSETAQSLPGMPESIGAPDCAQSWDLDALERDVFDGDLEALDPLPAEEAPCY